ncbi:hypothetical protein DFH29DRAFT_943221 [Suillus ampliporus]|nr:hypothetical protein DFH29DRAFT_943221 [Suillus ampliporus]
MMDVPLRYFYGRAEERMQELGMPFIIGLLLLIGRLISAWHILHKFAFTYVTCIWKSIAIVMLHTCGCVTSQASF